MLTSKVKKGKAEEGAKFSDYFDFGQRIKDMPSHRALAMLRGRNEGVLDLDLDVAHEEGKPHPAEGKIKVGLRHRRSRPPRRRVAGRDRAPGLEGAGLPGRSAADLLARLKERADAEAIRVFSKNLKDLLLAAPAGPARHHGARPRHPHRRQGRGRRPDRQGRRHDDHLSARAQARLAGLARGAGGAVHASTRSIIVSVGNGTASRETDKLVAELMAKMPNLKLTKAMVSEAGASVYSASELAAKEFPDLDVTLRGAVSIARRLQDPLAELVKIDPKAIGVGQYQHDVDQSRARPLARRRGGGLRELGGRRREHGVGAAAGARVGPQPDAGRQHRRLPRRERRLQDAHRA